MSLYLDASTIVPLFIAEPGTDPINRLLGAEPASPLVSDLAMGELASAFARRMRMGELTLARAEATLTFADTWRQADCAVASLDPADMRRAVSFVRQFNLKLRMPDAIHAATCQRLGVTLVTFDRRLAAAATALGISVTVPT